MAIDYERMVSLLFKRSDFQQNLDATLHAAVGISGEAGELLDAIKKGWAYGKPLDLENIIEELGDLEFYLEAFRQRLGIDRQVVLERNQAKLGVRYSSGVYSDQHAIERKDKQMNCGTPTGRITNVAPNRQDLPGQAVGAPLADLDFAGVELRILAHVLEANK